MNAAPGDDHILQTAADLLRDGREFVLITVVATKGSTPRNAGARMLWLPHGSTGPHANPTGAIGTVGGGQFEHLVIDAARACLEARSCTLEHFVLGADADQCCGGAMDVFLEYHGRPAHLVIFGAGHVAAALCPLLSFSPLQITVVDDRADWNSEARFPRARRVHAWAEGIAIAHDNPAATLAIVMTCSHDTDYQLLLDLLKSPPAFLGLIGSRSKRACLFSRLTGAGADAAGVQKVVCPIGVGDTGKEPQAVAISMAAQLLMEAKKLVPHR